jgi:catechol 2,3-dioxygenase-like lactoylglutathione lyase family enzyme
VQLAMPPGLEDDARAFYHGVLGMTEQPKPANLARRGGVWFVAGDAHLHLGVETEFRPARKAHPALLVTDLAVLVERCRSAGYQVTSDEPLSGCDRAYVTDPFGNRLELLQQSGGG